MFVSSTARTPATESVLKLKVATTGPDGNALQIIGACTQE